MRRVRGAQPALPLSKLLLGKKVNSEAGRVALLGVVSACTRPSAGNGITPVRVCMYDLCGLAQRALLDNSAGMPAVQVGGVLCQSTEAPTPTHRTHQWEPRCWCPSACA